MIPPPIYLIKSTISNWTTVIPVTNIHCKLGESDNNYSIETDDLYSAFELRLSSINISKSKPGQYLDSLTVLQSKVVHT